MTPQANRSGESLAVFGPDGDWASNQIIGPLLADFSPDDQLDDASIFTVFRRPLASELAVKNLDRLLVRIALRHLIVRAR